MEDEAQRRKDRFSRIGAAQEQLRAKQTELEQLQLSHHADAVHAELDAVLGE